MEVTSLSPTTTQKIARDIAKNLTGGDVIALYGELGAGKTVFAQGLAKGLKIKKRIISPTFVFMRSYPITRKDKNLTFYHIDLYKGETERDFRNLGLNEVFTKESIVVLEWAEKIQKSLPKKRIEVHIKKIDDNKRRIKIKRT